MNTVGRHRPNVPGRSVAALCCSQFISLAAAPETESPGLEAIVVTAQKRTENLQSVPTSIDASDTQKLEQLHIVDLYDYVKHSPSTSYARGQGHGGNGQPGSSHVCTLGVISGGDGSLRRAHL